MGERPITDEEHAKIMAGGRVDPEPFVCHSRIEDGKIHFYLDCSHSMAEQTAELPKVERG